MQTNDQSITDKKIIPAQKLVELEGPRPRLKEFKFAIQIFFEFIKGFRALNFVGPCITVFGSARFKEGHPYYEQARKMGQKIAELGFVTMTGGGPGIMEAANRGAKEANGISVGLTISLPFEATSNQYISDGLDLKFHYFFMRKFWFIYLAKALVVWPGGFGTLDAVMELLTLIQTEKIKKKLPIVLYGSDFWNNVINWDYLVDCGTISESDLDLFHISDDIDDSYDYITKYIKAYKLTGPNF